jgi:hypothetical protein
MVGPARAAPILLCLVAAFSIDASDAGVSVYTGHDDSLCEKPSTVSIDEGGCAETDLFNCTAYAVGAGLTYYGQRVCSDSREAYLVSTFGDTPLFMEQHYEDGSCTKLKSTTAYLADGECHYFTLGAMKIWLAGDNSMAALTVAGSCDSDDWSVFMDLNVSVNTGVCIEQGTESVMYALVGNLPPSGTLGGVMVSTGYDDSCESPSTASIGYEECFPVDGSCKEFAGVGGWNNVTYYGRTTCISSRDDYLQSTFGDSPVFMAEYYQDAGCKKLVKSAVYRADGKCHYFTLGIIKTWVSDDNSMAAVLTSSYCDSSDWSVLMDLNVSVNTGACIAQSDYGIEAVKYVLRSAPTPATPSDPSVGFGDILWPDRDASLCARPATCRDDVLGKLDNRGFLRLLELSDSFLERGGLYGRLPPREYTKDNGHLPELLLKLLLQGNDRLVRLLESVCGGVHHSILSQELDDCRCVHDQLLRGLSAARKVQSLAGIHGWDFKFCDVLMQREHVLYQETRSILTGALR